MGPCLPGYDAIISDPVLYLYCSALLLRHRHRGRRSDLYPIPLLKSFRHKVQTQLYVLS